MCSGPVWFIALGKTVQRSRDHGEDGVDGSQSRVLSRWTSFSREFKLLVKISYNEGNLKQMAELQNCLWEDLVLSWIQILDPDVTTGLFFLWSHTASLCSWSISFFSLLWLKRTKGWNGHSVFMLTLSHSLVPHLVAVLGRQRKKLLCDLPSLKN